MLVRYKVFCSLGTNQISISKHLDELIKPKVKNICKESDEWAFLN